MPHLATAEQSEALEQYVDGLEMDVIKEIFAKHTVEDLRELLEYHTDKQNYNICAALRDCIQERTM